MEHTTDEAVLSFTVTDADTAEAVGSGSLAVLGTPRLLAWCEAATCEALALQLEPGTTSVGVRVELDHLAASPVGRIVEIRARVHERAGRIVTFAVDATDEHGTVIGRGVVRRAVVDVDRFLAKLA
jgi:fluoroacetyl-CoA thioesterase